MVFYQLEFNKSNIFTIDFKMFMYKSFFPPASGFLVLKFSIVKNKFIVRYLCFKQIELI